MRTTNPSGKVWGRMTHGLGNWQTSSGARAFCRFCAPSCSGAGCECAVLFDSSGGVQACRRQGQAHRCEVEAEAQHCRGDECACCTTLSRRRTRLLPARVSPLLRSRSRSTTQPRERERPLLARASLLLRSRSRSATLSWRRAHLLQTRALVSSKVSVASGLLVGHISIPTHNIKLCLDLDNMMTEPTVGLAAAAVYQGNGLAPFDRHYIRRSTSRNTTILVDILRSINLVDFKISLNSLSYFKYRNLYHSSIL